MKIIILRGVPGAGKSTWAATQEFPANTHFVSADHFFVGQDGIYRYDFTKIKEAHGQCLRHYTNLVYEGTANTVVVDNTNSSIAEVAPYVALADAYGHSVAMKTLIVNDPFLAWKRNVHGVPFKTVMEMHQRLLTEKLPPWWRDEWIPITL